MANDRTKDKGLVKEIQKVLLDDAAFLRVLVQENLQKILHAEFELQIPLAGNQQNMRGLYTLQLQLKLNMGKYQLEKLLFAKP